MNFVPLSKNHARADFDCGLEPANVFLKTKALKHQKQRVSRTFIWSPDNDSTIGAFYSLSYHTLQREDMPKPGQFPHYPLPCCKLCWLAVDDRIHGRGVGSEVLVMALRHGYQWMQHTAGVAMVLDAIDDQALEWYLGKEFMRVIPGQERALIISAKGLAQL